MKENSQLILIIMTVVNIFSFQNKENSIIFQVIKEGSEINYQRSNNEIGMNSIRKRRYDIKKVFQFERRFLDYEE
jgi:hypothetical protein